MKDELGGEIMTEFAGLRPKMYSYLADDGDWNKKAKSIEKCVVKRKLKFEDYKHRLKAARVKHKTKYLEKNNFNVDNLSENHRNWFIKSNELVLKPQ